MLVLDNKGIHLGLLGSVSTNQAYLLGLLPAFRPIQRPYPLLGWLHPLGILGRERKTHPLEDFAN